ncbi:MAG: class I SAM-dependent methyltransferase [Haloquadratum sp.]|jgi:ubiquinone/menaquinone biosynthesis C-methylase UbiE|nr:class I SAM-dependent methyltransferase [Haloquadratum sp.]
MGFHVFDADLAENLDDPDRYRYCSTEELLAPLPAQVGQLMDIGSGTGFYTEALRSTAQRLLAVDIQPAMHRIHQERRPDPRVRLLTAAAASLPLADGAVDAAVSTATFHEFAGGDAMAELARVIAPGGTVVTVDWSADGRGETGPPVQERYSLGEAITRFETAGFATTMAEDRAETFRLVSQRT